MTLPNFVIIGAPKCATDSVARWLARHPDCAMTNEKEPFYLMDAATRAGGQPTWATHGIEGYEALFERTRGFAVRFEATTHYYFQDIAFEVLRDLPTQPRVAMLVRQPSDRFRSWFRFNQNHLANVDASLSFADTVDAILGGRPAVLRPRCVSDATYRAITDGIRHGAYVDYVTRWRALGDRFRVFVTEDLRSDERAVMRALAGWLEIDPAPFETERLADANVAYDVKRPQLHRAARRAARLLPIPGPLRRRVARVYRWAQGRPPASASPADLEALARLDEHYREPNARLAELLDRPDLPALWARDRRAR